MGVRVYWVLRRKGGRVYLVRILYVDGGRREEWLGNVEEIRRIVLEHRKRNPRPYHKPREGKEPRGAGPRPAVAGPGGFEPPTTGLGGRRSILAELRALPGPHMWLGYVGEAYKVEGYHEGLFR